MIGATGYGGADIADDGSRDSKCSDEILSALSVSVQKSAVK